MNETELLEAITILEIEVKALEGKLDNSDPDAVAALERENQSMTQRLEKIATALIFLTRERSQPASPDDAKYQTDVLRRSAMDYCQKLKIDPSIWKKIES